MLLVVPFFTQADIPQISESNLAVFNPPATFTWTPEIAKQYVIQQAEAVGMNQMQVSKFVKTLSCESEGFRDPAIQSGYYKHGRREPSFGLAQIDLDFHPEITKEQATDPTFAVPWAAQKFKENPYQWSCFDKIK